MVSTKTKFGLAVLLTAGVMTLVVLQQRANTQLRRELAALREQVAQSAPSSPGADAAELAKLRAEHDELLRLRGEVARLRPDAADAQRGRQRAETELAALQQKIAPLQSNVVVSLGTVEDIGRRAGALLPALGELQALAGRDPATLSPEEKRRLLALQRDHAQLLGALPEITKFQDNPDEYGRFFSSLLQQAAGLSESQVTQVNDYMRERATLMNQQELNAGKEPSDPKLEEAWEERRDKFNEQTAEGLKKMLPPGLAEKAGFGPELMEFLEMDFDKLDGNAANQKTR